MINLPFAKNKTYYVVGLGKSNRATIKSLQKSGAQIYVWDDNPENLFKFEKNEIREPSKAPWSKIKAVVMAPGIPPSHEVVAIANEKNVSVICDVDLFAQSQPKTKIIGVTGTNGKSTTTALIHHILNYNDKSQMGGNIGTPVFDLKQKCDYTVLELSSYQLDRAPNLRCDVAILLNITPDHLEWHGDMDEYVEAKAKIFNGALTKIISVDDEYSKGIAKSFDDALPLTVHGEELPFNQSEFSRLKGNHNLQNILAAYMACQSLDVPHGIIIERIKSFEGLAHRQFLVRVINGVAYINDSKATNVDATKMALKAYRNIIWIAGGRAKKGGIEMLAPDLGSVQKAVLYGEAKDEFYDFLHKCGIECVKCDGLDDAVSKAHDIAQDLRGEPSGTPTILLSPACASFDQYNNFEERGDHFMALVEGLSDE